MSDLKIWQLARLVKDITSELIANSDRLDLSINKLHAIQDELAMLESECDVHPVAESQQPVEATDSAGH